MRRLYFSRLAPVRASRVWRLPWDAGLLDTRSGSSAARATLRTRRGDRFGRLGDQPDDIVRHLKKTAPHIEPPGAPALSPTPAGAGRFEAQHPATEQRHHGRVTRQDADLAVECRSDER